MLRLLTAIFITALALLAASNSLKPKSNEPQFQTSDRCMACHNSLVDSSGDDISIGFHWRASIMANSSRDPYWQASSRREVMEHPESQAHIEDDCSVCHMPIPRYESKLRGKPGEIFTNLPLSTDDELHRHASDGVTCSVCHQVAKDKLGTRDSFNGGFVVHGPDEDGRHSEYGPFTIQAGLQTIMRSSTEGYKPEQSLHIRDSEVCATCHTLYTDALAPGGKVVGTLAEQMPYPEWLHSDYRNKVSCQGCHMPAIDGAVQVSRVLGEQREGTRLHSFIGGNFFMLQMLDRYRGELSVAALPTELSANAQATSQFLATRAATLAIENIAATGSQLQADIVIHNKTGHKLPSAFPSRRVWLHLLVRDHNGRIVFESGAINPDGSIVGNDNDADPTKYEPHYTEIRNRDQVEIYESILGDPNDHVTTGLLAASKYLKDNRLLPDGFDKQTADKDIEVVGNARNDSAFIGGSHRVRYIASLGNAGGPFTVEAELWYQPIGYRWANNLKLYDTAPEPLRFNGYFDSMQSNTGAVLARATATAAN